MSSSTRAVPLPSTISNTSSAATSESTTVVNNNEKEKANALSLKLASWQRMLLSRRGIWRVPRHKISLGRSKYMVIRVSSRCVATVIFSTNNSF